MEYKESSISSIAKNLSYEELIKRDEKEWEEILKYQNSKKNLINIIKNCIQNLEKNILKHYPLLICLDKSTPFIENDIFDSKGLEDIFSRFKNEFIEYNKNVSQNNGEDISQRNQDEKDKQKTDSFQSEQIVKRLEFLKFLIEIQLKFKEYTILKTTITEQFLNKEQKKELIIKFLEEFKKKEESLKFKQSFKNEDYFKKEEILLYEFLILEYNYLEDNLEYKVNKIEINDFNYKIKLKKFENIKYFKEFFFSFINQKDKDVIEEMIKFIFNYFNSTNNLNYLFQKCEDYLNESSMKNSNIIDLCKYAINNSEKKSIVKIKSLSSLSKKTIFKFTISSNDKKKDLYFYGNTRINEINNYLNNNLKDFKKNEDGYFMIEYIDDKDKKNVSFDEFDSNKTLNELIKNVKQLEVREEIFDKNKLLDNNNKLTEKFSEILTDWFNIFSKQKDIMNREDIANCFNKLSGKTEPFFHQENIKIYQFLKNNSKSYEKITLDEFKTFFKNASQDQSKYVDVINNIKNMNLTPNLTGKILEIDNSKLPRYYLSNKVNEFNESYLWKSLTENFTCSLNEDIFNFMSFLCVNEQLYNNVLNSSNVIFS